MNSTSNHYSSKLASDEPVGNSEREHLVRADVLLAGRKEVVIVHEGARYRLRVTASNKLILTK